MVTLRRWRTHRTPMDLVFFRLVMFKATEKVNVETHKAKEDADDFDFIGLGNGRPAAKHCRALQLARSCSVAALQ